MSLFSDWDEINPSPNYVKTFGDLDKILNNKSKYSD